jgi:alkanesulfonate monooxygenase SsuD/methylene tetrahydromethanopterin reductase-like flavin-dependent oxidoreductase (luciferase family)
MQLWVGGRSFRSLRRAVELADGWMPFGLSPEELRSMLTRARTLTGWHERARPLELVLNTDTLVDPIGEPRSTVEVLSHLFAAGATRTQLAFSSRSPSHCIEQMEAMAALAESEFA